MMRLRIFGLGTSDQVASDSWAIDERVVDQQTTHYRALFERTGRRALGGVVYTLGVGPLPCDGMDERLIAGMMACRGEGGTVWNWPLFEKWATGDKARKDLLDKLCAGVAAPGPKRKPRELEFESEHTVYTPYKDKAGFERVLLGNKAPFNAEAAWKATKLASGDAT